MGFHNVLLHVAKRIQSVKGSSKPPAGGKISSNSAILEVETTKLLAPRPISVLTVSFNLLK